MGMDCGAAGAYGILLSEEEPSLVAELNDAYHLAVESESDDPETQVSDDHLDRVRGLLAKKGIVLPASANLLFTGTGDDRPARCATPFDDWVAGFGLFMNPQLYPEMHPSFADRARWWTWVWMG